MRRQARISSSLVGVRKELGVSEPGNEGAGMEQSYFAHGESFREGLLDCLVPLNCIFHMLLSTACPDSVITSCSTMKS